MMKNILYFILLGLNISIAQAQITKAGPGFYGNPVCATSDNKGNIYFVSSKIFTDTAKVYKYQLSTKTLSKVVDLFPSDSSNFGAGTSIRYSGAYTRILCIEDSIYVSFSQDRDPTFKGYTDILYRIVGSKPRIVGFFGDANSMSYAPQAIKGLLNYKGKLTVYHLESEIEGIKGKINSDGLTLLTGNTWVSQPGLGSFNGIGSAAVLNDSLIISIPSDKGYKSFDSIYSYNKGTVRGLKFKTPFLAIAGDKIVCSNYIYDQATFMYYSQLSGYQTGSYSTKLFNQKSQYFYAPSRTCRNNNIYTYIADSGMYYNAQKHLLRYNNKTGVFDEIYEYSYPDSSMNFSIHTDSGIFLFSSGEIVYNGNKCSQFAQLREQGMKAKVFAGLQSINPITISSFSVYPNPANAILHLYSNSAQTQQIHVYDALGKYKNSITLLNHASADIATDSWPAGMYYLRNSAGESKTIIVQ